jgi:hypothetical protein
MEQHGGQVRCGAIMDSDLDSGPITRVGVRNGCVYVICDDQ